MLVFSKIFIFIFPLELKNQASKARPSLQDELQYQPHNRGSQNNFLPHLAFVGSGWMGTYGKFHFGTAIRSQPCHKSNPPCWWAVFCSRANILSFLRSGKIPLCCFLWNEGCWQGCLHRRRVRAYGCLPIRFAEFWGSWSFCTYYMHQPLVNSFHVGE